MAESRQFELFFVRGRPFYYHYAFTCPGFINIYTVYKETARIIRRINQDGRPQASLITRKDVMWDRRICEWWWEAAELESFQASIFVDDTPFYLVNKCQFLCTPISLKTACLCPWAFHVREIFLQATGLGCQYYTGSILSFSPQFRFFDSHAPTLLWIHHWRLLITNSSYSSLI